MKLFFDTNVLIAAFLTRGNCTEVFEYCLVNHTIYVSDFVLAELLRVMQKKLKFSKQEAESIITYLKKNCVIIESTTLPQPVSIDPDDDNILAGTIQGKVQAIITGDQDLLVLETHAQIAIIQPNNFWHFEQEQ